MKILVTGGAGFIGSALIFGLNQRGIREILIVDHWDTSRKWRNLLPLQFEEYIDREEFFVRLQGRKLPPFDGVLHMGAITRTDEKDMGVLFRWNVEFTLLLAEYAVEKRLPFLYASSGAVYGDGSLGFSDGLENLFSLRPLNPYGFSKLWVDREIFRRGWFDRVTAVRFFNVYGPNEYHKGNMRSVIPVFTPQILKERKVRLFESNDPAIPNGEQKRDFVYVEDVVSSTLYLFFHQKGGIYNIGTGTARSFLELVEILWSSLVQMGKIPPSSPAIEWIPLPEEIRCSYQNYTKAEIHHLLQAGYTTPFTPLEEGIPRYLSYLLSGERCLGDPVPSLTGR
jgi:ADP-L-glycero-D-manno-heptose 6-epimerase